MLHCIALHCIALHCFAFQKAVVGAPQCYIALHCHNVTQITLHCFALHCISQSTTMLHNSHCFALLYSKQLALPYIALNCHNVTKLTLHCIALFKAICIALLCYAFHVIEKLLQHCIAILLKASSYCVAFPFPLYQNQAALHFVQHQVKIKCSGFNISVKKFQSNDSALGTVCQISRCIQTLNFKILHCIALIAAS